MVKITLSTSHADLESCCVPSPVKGHIVQYWRSKSIHTHARQKGNSTTNTFRLGQFVCFFLCQASYAKMLSCQSFPARFLAPWHGPVCALQALVIRTIVVFGTPVSAMACLNEEPPCTSSRARWRSISVYILKGRMTSARETCQLPGTDGQGSTNVRILMTKSSTTSTSKSKQRTHQKGKANSHSSRMNFRNVIWFDFFFFFFLGGASISRTKKEQIHQEHITKKNGTVISQIYETTTRSNPCTDVLHRQQFKRKIWVTKSQNNVSLLRFGFQSAFTGSGKQ